MQIIRVRNPGATRDPALQDFMLEALTSVQMAWSAPEAVVPELLERALSPMGALHIAMDRGQYRGISITTLPSGPVDELPRVVLFYVRRGSKKGLRQALIQGVVDFLKENHYTKGWAINGTGRPDSLYARMFRKAGKIKKVGSIMEFDLA